MRTLLVALGLAAQSIAAAAFLSPVTPERPVSQRLFGAPAGDQRTLAVASNGAIAFAVWLDARRGGYQTDLYGARIDPAGVSLDPLGILIATSVSNGTVIWNGSAFVVISEGNSLGTTFTYIAPDGTQIDQKSIRINQALAATMDSGPDARILFAGYGAATVVDAGARIVAADVRYGLSQPVLAAGSNKSEFLILRNGDITNRLYAERFDRDGKHISTNDTGVDFSIVGTVLSLAGSDDDYLLAGRGPTGREVMTVHLGLDGVTKHPPSQQAASTALDRVPYPPAKPAIVVDGDVYVLAWTTSAANGEAYTTILELPVSEDGIVILPLVRPLGPWTGTGYGTVLGLAGSRVILVSDAFRAGVSTTIDPIATVLESPYGKALLPFALSSSATHQAAPQVASAAGGYAVLWNEYGPDGATHLLLRRFLAGPIGAPVDAAPIEVASDATGSAITARIAAAGDTYAVAWSTFDTFATSNYVLRRLSATTGSWLDPAPVPLAAHTFELTLGASSNRVLAVYAVNCPTQRCMHARAIAIDSGAPLRTPETPSLAPTASDIAIGSNGTDFLVAWTPNTCFGGVACDIISRYELFVQRVGGDGMPLDSKPLTLDYDNFLSWPSIAWSGGAYVVTWAVFNPGTIRASRLTANGVLAETQHMTNVRPGYYQAQRVVATGNGLFLLTTGSSVTEGMTLDPQSLLASGLPVTIAIDRLLNESFSTAATPDGLVIAYDRVDAGSGNVERVFSRVFGNTVRRRSVR
jgi:hypothetical protein